MTKLLLKLNLNIDDKHQKYLNELFAQIGSNIENDFLYDGQSNQEILDFYPDSKVYQFNENVLNVYTKLKLSKIDTGYNLHAIEPISHRDFELGSLSAIMTGKIQQILNTYQTDIKSFLTGGRYKKVIVSEDSSDHIKSYREPYKIQVTIVEKNEEPKVEYVPEAIQKIKNGQTFYCKNCNGILRGERICPQCGNIIYYPTETNQASNFERAARGLENTGNSMSAFGKEMTIGCTIPILLIIILGALLF